MRNIFDQYSQPENRVTHALMTALDQDRILLASFLRELVKVKAPVSSHKLSVLEQRYPGEDEPDEEELEGRGIPDGWIYDDKGWCVLIETKVISKLTSDQIHRHRRTAERRGFEHITAVAITPYPPVSFPLGTVLLEWRTVYTWLRRHGLASVWAARAADYLEIAEAKLIEKQQLVEGTLTEFSGFPFGYDHPFTYLEGKRVLGLALGELRLRRDLRNGLGMQPKTPGRSAITGSQGDAVWDFLSITAPAKAKTFTEAPHLTLNVVSHAIEAMITVPNAVNGLMRRNLIQLGEQGFTGLIKEIVSNTSPLLRKCEGGTPWFRGVQRRYLSQRAPPIVDARIDFDLRTAFKSEGPPKQQSQWLSAAYGSFVDKKRSNYQMQVGVIFRYDRCPELRSENALNLVAGSWLACKPLIDLMT